MRRKTAFFLAACAALLGVTLLADIREKPLRVVPHVDFARYAGKWYEIARLPNRFENSCESEVTAEYSVLPDGDISVLNSCRRADGTINHANGVARIADKSKPNSMLKVRFAPAFLSFIPQVWGDYEIIALSPEYSYALIGETERKYLWILSRTPDLGDSAYNQLMEEAKSQGFDVSRLQRTRQPAR